MEQKKRVNKRFQDGFAQLLHAEWTKFRTVRGWVIGMVPWAKAGVIIKESIEQGSAYAAVILTGSHGVWRYDAYRRINFAGVLVANSTKRVAPC